MVNTVNDIKIKVSINSIDAYFLEGKQDNKLATFNLLYKYLELTEYNVLAYKESENSLNKLQALLDKMSKCVC